MKNKELIIQYLDTLCLKIDLHAEAFLKRIEARRRGDLEKVELIEKLELEPLEAQVYFLEEKLVGLNQKINMNEDTNKTPVYFEDILADLENVLPGKSNLLTLALAVSISHFVDKKTPLWLMFVGVPASGKTEVVRMTEKASWVYFLDSLTENAFSSGLRGSEDLLPIINEKCLVIKDFTTTLSQKEEAVKKILGDLTSIYDDSFAKHSPTRGTVRYKAFLSFLGCVTPQALNNHQRYMNQVGPRFLFYRVPASGEEQIKKVFSLLWDDENRKSKIELLQEKISQYCSEIIAKMADSHLGKEKMESIAYLNSLALFLAKARGTVLTQKAEFMDDKGEKVTFYEPVDTQVEEPFRALLQLRVLTRSIAVIRGEREVGEYELNLVRDVALSSMPADRSVLLSVIASEDREWSAKEVADKLGISHRTASRQLDELVWLKILRKQAQGSGLANLYSVNTEFRGVIYVAAESRDLDINSAPDVIGY